MEPSVPPGLGKLTPSQRALAEFLHLDEDLIDIAAEGSGDAIAQTLSREDLVAWVTALPTQEKDTLLLAFLEEKVPHQRATLLQRFRQEQLSKTKAPANSENRRRVSELANRVTETREALERALTLAAARQREREKQQAAELREKQLRALANRVEGAWKDVDRLANRKVAASYDEAVKLLKDLRDAAQLVGKSEEFQKRLVALRGRHEAKYKFIERLDLAGLKA